MMMIEKGIACDSAPLFTQTLRKEGRERKTLSYMKRSTQKFDPLRPWCRGRFGDEFPVAHKRSQWRWDDDAAFLLRWKESNVVQVSSIDNTRAYRLPVRFNDRREHSWYGHGCAIELKNNGLCLKRVRCVSEYTVWTKRSSPLSSMYLIWSRRDWKSVQFEALLIWIE